MSYRTPVLVKIEEGVQDIKVSSKIIRSATVCKKYKTHKSQRLNTGNGDSSPLRMNIDDINQMNSN